jgi:hypothetical protein
MASTIKKIEYHTLQQVQIATINNGENLAKCHLQQQSALYSKLPLELRELIWQLATAPCSDTKNPYDETAWYYRPGNTHRKKHHTSLLLTCRRIWLEANAYPMLQGEHCFWYYRAAPDGRDLDWTAKLTTSNLRNFGTLHLYAQMFAIERLSPRPGALRRYFVRDRWVEDLAPKVMYVTIRHTDWYWWEQDMPLALDESWVQAMLDTEDLRSTILIRLELETLDYKVEQLKPIVERLRKLESKEYQTHLVEGEPTATRFILQDIQDTYTWTGSSKINDDDYVPYAGRDTLNYHVVTLTWRLAFTQLLKAHVPTLRLAPRYHGNSQRRPARHERPTTPSSQTRFEVRHVAFRPVFKSIHLDALDPVFRFDLDGTLRDLGVRERMMDTQLFLNAQDKRRADLEEAHRSCYFDTQMEKIRTIHWQERWEQEGSLLSFGGKKKSASGCYCEVDG